MRVIRNLVRWTGLCAACGLMSFVLASMAGFQIQAVLAGASFFCLAWGLLASTDAFEQFLSKPFVRRTLQIGFGTLIAINLFLPVGFAANLGLGALSIHFTQPLFAKLEEPAGTFVTTLVHGALLHCVLFAYMAIVYGVQRAFLPKPVREGYCSTCDYNLTGNVSGRCPECGTVIPEGVPAGARGGAGDAEL